MAGNYPDVPGHRFVMDRDGTQMYMFNRSTNAITQLSNAQIIAMQDESVGVYSGPKGVFMSLIVYFPEPRTVSGLFYIHMGAGTGGGSPYPIDVKYSTDTTNGQDGTWNSLLSGGNTPTQIGLYRDNISPVSASNVKALSFGGSTTIYQNDFVAVHVYGDIPTSGSPDRLSIWHPTLDEPIGGAYFDWGDSPRSSSEDRTFRVKNLSGSLTANNILIGFDALTDSTPPIAGMHLVSDDGTTFAATETIPSLGPGVISSVMTMRRVLPSNAPLGLWAPRIHAIADSWS